jgi:hypothetical protein
MGAFTAALTSARAPRMSLKTASSGTANMVHAVLTGSASYATNGDTINFGSSFGLIGNGKTTPDQPTAIIFSPSSGGHSAWWDKTNNKVKVFNGTTEIANTTNLSTFTFPAVLFFGQ